MIKNKKFSNAINNVPQKVPPIWFMRQAGRYHSHYQKLRKINSFVELCKTPDLAAEVAMGPIDDFDYDVAILFSDILFHLEGLGLPLKFNPGPKFEWNLDEDNWVDHKNTIEAGNFLKFQKKAIQVTRESLKHNKSLIGFVGGPWTLLNYAVGDEEVSLEFKHMYLQKVFIPLLQYSIKDQLEAGADAVMIFDSGLENIHKSFFDNQYCALLKQLAENF